jgi:hypothetical protein
VSIQAFEVVDVFLWSAGSYSTKLHNQDPLELAHPCKSPMTPSLPARRARKGTPQRRNQKQSQQNFSLPPSQNHILFFQLNPFRNPQFYHTLILAKNRNDGWKIRAQNPRRPCPSKKRPYHPRETRTCKWYSLFPSSLIPIPH